MFQMGEVTVEVLRGVSLELAAAELTVVEGPSGSGKTTMLNLIGGLDQPTRGHVWFKDSSLAEMSAAELTNYRRRHVGFVFQFYNLISSLTVRENVLAATELVDGAMAAEEVLELVGLGHRLDHFPGQLSGGEQQRTAIARAVAKNPELLLCDEPTGSLDVETGKKVLALLRDLQRRLGMSIVIVTHNTAIAAMADRIVRIRSGRIVHDERNARPLEPELIEW
jgi:putative ABC transport system ATP-binding protein